MFESIGAKTQGQVNAVLGSKVSRLEAPSPTWVEDSEESSLDACDSTGLTSQFRMPASSDLHVQDAGNSCRQDVYDSVSVSESWHVRHRRSDIFAAARAYQHLLTSRKGQGQHLRRAGQDCGSGMGGRRPEIDGDSPQERVTSLDQELARCKLGCGKFKNHPRCALGLIGLP